MSDPTGGLLSHINQGDDHGQESKENRPKGEKASQVSRAGCRQVDEGGAGKMNYTLTQAIDRTKDLSGLLKAARAHEADCAADHEAKRRIAEIAGEAHNKAIGQCIELEAEREELADHIAALVRRTGDPIDAEPVIAAGQSDHTGPGPMTLTQALHPENKFDVFGGFEAEALANGEARLNQAFEEATR